MHPGRAPEAYGRLVDHPPTLGVNLNHLPFLIAEVEIDAAIQPAEADVDDTFRPTVVRLGLKDIQCGLSCLGARGAVSFLITAPNKPVAKSLGSDRPGLTAAVDEKVGIGNAVRRMEKNGL